MKTQKYHTIVYGLLIVTLLSAVACGGKYKTPEMPQGNHFAETGLGGVLWSGNRLYWTDERSFNALNLDHLSQFTAWREKKDADGAYFVVRYAVTGVEAFELNGQTVILVHTTQAVDDLLMLLRLKKGTGFYQVSSGGTRIRYVPETQQFKEEYGGIYHFMGNGEYIKWFSPDHHQQFKVSGRFTIEEK